MPLSPVYGAPVYAQGMAPGAAPMAAPAAAPNVAPSGPMVGSGTWLSPAHPQGGSITSMGLMSPFGGQPANAAGGGAGLGDGSAGGMTPYENAFNTFLDSTGYRFMFNQGQQGIENSAAARGLLGSGATGKALTEYGQNIGKKYFADYLGQLGGVNSALGATAGAGQNALGQIATAGTAGGGNAASAIINGASNQGNAIMQGAQANSNMWSGLGNSLGGALNSMGATSSNVLGGAGSFFGF